MAWGNARGASVWRVARERASRRTACASPGRPTTRTRRWAGSTWTSVSVSGEQPEPGMPDAGLLAALQLGDSLFPSGGFTLSHGLETLAERLLVVDARSL